MSEYVREVLELPPGYDRSRDKLLLHSCCAPCSGEVMEAIQASGIDYAIFFYNPNIHPLKEYELRKEENIRFAEKHNVPFIDADYDTDNWFARAKGMENEPERGIRCTMCFDMRFERTALYAHEHGYSLISSSLGISRWKNMAQINDCGARAATRYPGIEYWDYNRRLGAHDRDLQARGVLPAGILRLRLFAARHQPPSQGPGPRTHRAWRAVLRRRRTGRRQGGHGERRAEVVGCCRRTPGAEIAIIR
jgi:predicted adenine nucleotide alpha hydrolase (AANH) superfamily ATPase